ncbi:MFS transporter [Chromobacterium sp. IIBBL 290-4]|uniref:MFS transporter n=1 Tax=Chromobacterium sp. IIBBL 290-4 TaxID=2953890 RepID=UPI0020B75124|nr:MFS transporter [Chromobacterium sp. IIBBL 290-4]UTH75537.1 MFS transporter [Chromobacterium sp. IIBBL 290-4]
MNNPSYQPLLPVSRSRALLFCLLLTSFELLVYLGSDMVMPAMLQVTRDMHASSAHVPTALNAYLLGGIAFQWLIGPLSDRYGRRPLLLIGAAGFAAACLAAAACGEITVFNLLRFFQGIALGFIVVVSYPALQETFREQDAVRLMSLLANIALLSPLVGPLLGSLLLEWMSWRTMFAVLGGLGLLVGFGLWRGMPETLGVVRTDGSVLSFTPLHLKQNWANYRGLLADSTFVCGSLALGLLTLPLIAWIGLSPLLLIRNLGYSGLEYGLWQLPVFGGVIVGNLLLNRLALSRSLPALLRLSLAPMVCGLLFAGASAWLAGGLPALVAGLTVYAVGLGLGNATLYRLTLFSSELAKGSVAAMLGMLSTAMLGGGVAAMSLAEAGDSPARFTAAILISSLLALPPLWRLLRQPPPQQQAA